MSFSNSSTLKIELSDPVDKYGNGYQVSNIYLTNSSYDQVINNLPNVYTLISNFHQEFDARTLEVQWEVRDPRNGNILKKKEDITKNPYISGIDIAVYENSGDLRGQDILQNRTKIYEESGVNDVKYSYSLDPNTDHRNYSFDVKLTDFTGNQTTGFLSTRNLLPNFEITTTEFSDGFYNIYYSGITDAQGADNSNGLQYINVYNFTGLTSGTSGYFSQSEDFINQSIVNVFGQYGLASLELSPGDDNYVMVLGVDQFGTGEQVGIYSGVDSVDPQLIRYDPTINNLTGQRLSGGDAFVFDFEANYNTGSSLITTCYGITGTGASSEAVQGYNDILFFASGVLHQDQLDYVNITGSQIIYDNSLPLQNGLSSGVLSDEVVFETEDQTGYINVGSGAGDMWANQCPKYSGFIESGSNVSPSGEYYYGYYDSSIEKFGCASKQDIEDNIYGIQGIYSMPSNNPNSYEINYRTGINFTKGYEQASSYLNEIGEMPAVIINPSQLDKIKNMNSGIGWVGLRRDKVGILSGLFSDNFVNQTLFKDINFHEETNRIIESYDALNNLEQSELIVNDVGNNWAWVNGSGNHIYKYAGSGYEKTREIDISIDIKRNRDNVILHTSNAQATAPLMAFDEVEAEPGELSVRFNYDFIENFYQENLASNDIQYQNYNITGLNLYTGDTEGFYPDDTNLMTGYNFSNTLDFDLQSGISVNFEDIPVFPEFFKMIPYDTIGSGVVKNLSEIEGFDPKPAITNQVSILSLDEAKYNNTNCISLEFKYQHTVDPIVTFGLSYTGSENQMSYLGAMIKGAPTNTGVDFILTEVPPATGYCLYVYSSQPT